MPWELAEETRMPWSVRKGGSKSLFVFQAESSGREERDGQEVAEGSQSAGRVSVVCEMGNA